MSPETLIDELQKIRLSKQSSFPSHLWRRLPTYGEEHAKTQGMADRKILNQQLQHLSNDVGLSNKDSHQSRS